MHMIAQQPFRIVCLCLGLVLSSLPVAGAADQAQHAPASSGHAADSGHAVGADHGHAGDAHADHSGDHTGGHGAGGHGGDDHGHHAYTLGSDLSLWSAIAFIGFCWAIKKLGLWDLMLSSMAEREKSAWERLDTADALLSQAESSLRKFRGQFEALEDTVRETLLEGERDVAYTKSEIVRIASAEAALAAGRATAEIERTRDQALNSIFEALAERVVEATSVKLKQQVHTGNQDALIDATLNRLAS